MNGLVDLSDRHTGMTLGQIAAQAATSGECELTKFTFTTLSTLKG